MTGYHTSDVPLQVRAYSSHAPILWYVCEDMPIASSTARIAACIAADVQLVLPPV